MFTAEGLLEIHKRTHKNLKDLLVHCQQLSEQELTKELDGFGYPTVLLQLHHEIGAEKYWVGVLQGRIDVDENISDYPTAKSLETYRQEIFSNTEAYLNSASEDELNTNRKMMTWGNNEKMLMPAHVFLRTQMHYYHHQGQILAMCRLFGKPANGFDFPID